MRKVFQLSLALGKEKLIVIPKLQEKENEAGRTGTFSKFHSRMVMKEVIQTD